MVFRGGRELRKIERKIHILQEVPYITDKEFKFDFYKTLCGWPEYNLKRTFMSVTGDKKKVTCKICLKILEGEK